MNQTPHEKSKLLIAMAAIMARKQRERRVKLNHPEVITRSQSIEAIPEMIPEGQMEATFHDGTKLVAINQPIR